MQHLPSDLSQWADTDWNDRGALRPPQLLLEHQSESAWHEQKRHWPSPSQVLGRIQHTVLDWHVKGDDTGFDSSFLLKIKAERKEKQTSYDQLFASPLVVRLFSHSLEFNSNDRWKLLIIICTVLTYFLYNEIVSERNMKIDEELSISKQHVKVSGVATILQIVIFLQQPQ